MLNSSIDVDNLDYTTRDTMNSGYANSTVDIEHLLNSFTVMKVYECIGENKIYFVGKNQIQHPVDCSHFHGENFNVQLSGKCKLGFYTKRVDTDKQIKATGKIRLENQNELKDEVHAKSLQTHREFSAKVINESIKNTILLNSGEETIEDKDGAEDWAQIFMQGTIKGNFSGKIYGKIENDEVVFGKKPVENEMIIKKNNYVIKYYQFAYDKNCQSVIDGAISARNFEYLWIYAHHTVTYHTNYLTTYLLEKYCDVLYERRIGKLKNTLDNILNSKKLPPCADNLIPMDNTSGKNHLKDSIIEILYAFLPYIIPSQIVNKAEPDELVKLKKQWSNPGKTGQKKNIEKYLRN